MLAQLEMTKTYTYELIEHTGDIAVRVSGRTKAELFEAAAFAFMDTITDAKKIQMREERNIKLTAIDEVALLVSWLSELLYLFDVKRFLTATCEVHTLAPSHLEATIQGEVFDPKRHQIKTELKAITYHGLTVQKTSSGFKTQIIFDV